MINYDPTIPFVEHFGQFFIPSTMAEAVSQYRLDLLHRVMNENGLNYAFFDVIRTNPKDGNTFGSLFHPLEFYGDTSLNWIKPGAVDVALPPLPNVMAEKLGFEYQSAEWEYMALVPERVVTLGDKDRVLFGTLVAQSMLDFDFKTVTDDALFRYLAVNNVESPFAKRMRESPDLWLPHKRLMKIPDMIATRKRDFTVLFEEHGEPLEPRELNCLSTYELVQAATDLRLLLLARNRHVVFCARCMNEITRLNAQVLAAAPQLPEHLC